MKPYNVIMVLLDGTRQDRLHLSKELISIAKGGVYFSNMVTSAPYTLAAMHSIFSGIYPTKNGVDAYYNMFKFKKDKCKVLAEYLKEKGYYTLSDIGNDSIVPNQGFDKFTIHDEYKDDLIKLHSEIIKDTIKDVSKNKDSDKPFFIFYQYDKIHTDTIINVAKKYDDFSEEFFNNKEENIKRYNGCLKEAGIYAKEIMDVLNAEKILDDTIVIFFSDHGVSNGERLGEKMYGSFLYDYTIKTFSIIIHPKLDSKIINSQIRSIDLMPTILDLLDITFDKNYEKVQGKSVIPFIEDKEKEDRIAFCETGGLKGPWPSPDKPNVTAVRYKNWKLIYNKIPDTWELYYLSEDSDEQINLYGKSLIVENELKEKLNQISRENRKNKTNPVSEFTNLKI